MKIDIARQPLVPAFVTLFALAVTAMWGGAGNGVSAGAPETMPLLGGALTRFQAAYPVWARLAAGFMILFTGMCTGRIAIRYNLYGVSTCLPIPLYAVVACGIFSGGNYLTAFAASMLLALAAKNYCRSYCNGYGFDAIFRASLYLGLLPLVYAPATPLVLILPLAILLFKRTFREAVVAAAGLILAAGEKLAADLHVERLERLRHLAGAGEHHVGVGGDLLHRQAGVGDGQAVVVGADGVGILRVGGVPAQAGAHDIVPENRTPGDIPA